MLYQKAGLKGAGLLFLMTDAQVPDERFLVIINDMLASGEIPDLFADDEVENIINQMRGEVGGGGGGAPGQHMSSFTAILVSFSACKTKNQLIRKKSKMPKMEKPRHFSTINILLFSFYENN